MTTTLPRSAPAQLVAGDTLEFLTALPGDLAGWTGSARLTGPSTMEATSVVTEGSDLHLLFEGQSAGGTKELLPGQYTLTVWATNANNRHTIAQFRLTIAPDLSVGTPALAHAIQMLDAIETAIAARVSGAADGPIEEYEINGRKVRKMGLSELYKLRTRYQAEVRTLQNPGRPIARVKAVFGPVGIEPIQTRRFS